MTATRTYQAIRAHVNGDYRTGTLYGKEYIVVPVIALVEGVIQGMSAEGPELALAEEFARFPDSWNGRPIVMSHPTKDGAPISANSPSVLEAYAIGFIFNAGLDGQKLVLEAWVDPDTMNDLNDDSKDILSVLKKGDMIEVSTGYFAQLEKTEGLYGNSSYEAIQRNIVPDHLAFLPNGVKGACSNADGCGAKLDVAQLRANQIKTFRVEKPCCDSCANGEHTHSEDQMPNANSKMDKTTEDATTKKRGKKGDPKAYEAPDPAVVANAFPVDMLSTDVCKLVSTALKVVQSYTYVVGMTQDKVVYETYNNFSGYYDTYQRSYDVSADGKVTLGDDIERVALISKIIAVNADGSEKETTMTTQTDPAAAPAPAVNKTQTVENEQGTLEVNFDAEGKATGFKLTPKANAVATKPATMDEFVAQAPAEYQEVINSSLKLHKEKKESIIKALKDSGRCKFDDAYLSAQSVETLESLAELASVPSFSGRAAPIAANRSEDENVTAAPLVFETKAANAA